MKNTSDVQGFVILNVIGQSQGIKKLTAVTGENAAQSLRRMKEVNDSTLKLIDDVKQKRNVETWQPRLTAIYKVNLAKVVP